MSRPRVGRRKLARVAETLAERDWALLVSLAEHRFLTTRHIQALHFDGHASPLAAARATRRVLARLHAARIVTHLQRRVGGVRAGSASYVWTLGPVGGRLLRERHGDNRSRRRAYEPSATFLDHTLAIADAHVALIQAHRDGELELVTVQVEPACWRHYLGSGGERLTLRPDLYVVTASGEYEDSWFIEIDRSTEHLPTLLGKCRAYVAYRASGREQTEHGVFPRVLWAVPDQRRPGRRSQPRAGPVPDRPQSWPGRAYGGRRPGMSRLPRNQILIGDATARLAELPDSSVDCIVTSPPYYGLRDYGTPGQLGLEPDVTAWVEQLVEMTRQARRVLTPRGSLWVNVGDSYAHTPGEGAPRKSLLLGPQRLALALVGDGWLLRNQVVWAKTNPMPESVTDRLSGTYEVVLFLARQHDYHFDLDAVRVPATSIRKPDGSRSGYPPSEVLPAGRIATAAPNHGLQKIKALGLNGHPLGKNPGDVWRLATAGYRGAHFASFPLGLVTPPILASCPERVCTTCRTPWQRDLERRHGRLLATGPLGPSCVCNADWRPGLVLDPFIGSGTTAIAAETHGRDWIGIEINEQYAALAEARIKAERDRRDRQRKGKTARITRTKTN